jgi:hypothetical protein
MVFIVSLATYVLMAFAQPSTSWANPYYFFLNINTPPIVAPQNISADEKQEIRKYSLITTITVCKTH